MEGNWSDEVSLQQDHWLRHYVGTLTNVRPPDSVRYFHN